MQRIRSRGNKSTELALARSLRKAGVNGWRRHLPLPGRPDFTFSAEKICVFVHGCFWHGCPTCYSSPVTNRDYWRKKVLRNTRRDRSVANQLRSIGYRVITIWECKLSAEPEACAVRIRGVCERRRSHTN